MSMIPPPPPIPGQALNQAPAAPMPPQTVPAPPQAVPAPPQAVPAPPAQVNAPQIPAAPELPPGMPAPGTVPVAQATGEIPTQIPLAAPPAPMPTYIQEAAPPSPPPMQPLPIEPVAQAAPEFAPAPPVMPAMPAMPPVAQMPPAPAPAPAPVQQLTPTAQPYVSGELVTAPQASTGIVPAAPIDYDRMSVAEIAEAMGIKGVDFTAYGTTPTISLNQGTFKTSDGTINLGTEFICRIHETRPKYLYVTRLADADPNHATAYSYDQQTSNGKSLKDILDSWAQKGIAWDLKNYLEATCMLEDGRVIMLSIPFTSMSRFAGFAQSVILSRRQMADVICKVGIGPLVTKAARPFNPISFEEMR